MSTSWKTCLVKTLLEKSSAIKIIEGKKSNAIKIIEGKKNIMFYSKRQNYLVKTLSVKPNMTKPLEGKKSTTRIQMCKIIQR